MVRSILNGHILKKKGGCLFQAASRLINIYFQNLNPKVNSTLFFTELNEAITGVG
jgi:hypothetical protein